MLLSRSGHVLGHFLIDFPSIDASSLKDAFMKINKYIFYPPGRIAYSGHLGGSFSPPVRPDDRARAGIYSGKHIHDFGLIRIEMQNFV
jgi:hypothetical protein